MTTYTIRCKLIAKEDDILDYHTLVFKTLEPDVPFGYNYVMCTVFPRWLTKMPEIGEIGILSYDEVMAGVDTYYNRNTDSIMKYNFSNLIFKKFVKEQDNSKEIIL